MAFTIRSVNHNATTANPITVTTAASPAAQVGDLLVIFHGNDYYALSNMPAPTVSPGSPTVTAPTGGTADAGSLNAHTKAYYAIVATAGQQTVSVTETGTGDEDKCLAVYVIAGNDPTTPIGDAAGAFNATASTSNPAPAVSPPAVNALMISHVNSGTGTSATSYTPPGSMTEQYDAQVGGISYTGATEQLTATGTTGTRTFTAVGNNVPYSAVSVAVQQATVSAWTYGYSAVIG